MNGGPLPGDRLPGGASRPVPEDPDLLDAYADRAIGRAASAVAVGSAALVLMTVLFMALTGGGADAHPPTVLILPSGALLGLVVAAGLHLVLRRLRRQVDTGTVDSGTVGAGPVAAADAVRWLGGLVLGAPVVATAAALLRISTDTEVLVSCAVGIAVVSQLAVLAAVQRSSLRRVAARR